jgi:N-acyl-D-amino-acid deacylase
MFGRLANADLADRIRMEMEQNLERRGGAEAMLVTEAGSPWRGMTLEEIAGSLQAGPLDAAIALVRQGDPSIASFTMQTEDIHAIAIQEWTMTGSDGSGGHPRKYATYPKVYRDMVLGAGLFPMERFVHRSSGLVADTFNLCDRGYLEVGRRADIVLIDLDDYRPVADYENPTALSTGVTDVFINGRPVIRGGELSGALPGVIIDRQRQDCPAH